jgi:hypothetical protein
VDFSERVTLLISATSTYLRHLDLSPLPRLISAASLLQDVGGSNTLHLESEPGKQDFRPLTMRNGQLCKFFGYSCHHYTVANTSESTRVSFDFR